MSPRATTDRPINRFCSLSPLKSEISLSIQAVRIQPQASFNGKLSFLGIAFGLSISHRGLCNLSFLHFSSFLFPFYLIFAKPLLYHYKIGFPIPLLLRESLLPLNHHTRYRKPPHNASKQFFDYSFRWLQVEVRIPRNPRSQASDLYPQIQANTPPSFDTPTNPPPNTHQKQQELQARRLDMYGRDTSTPWSALDVQARGGARSEEESRKLMSGELRNWADGFNGAAGR